MKSLTINISNWKEQGKSDFIDYLKSNKIQYEYKKSSIIVKAVNNKLEDMVEYLFDENSKAYSEYMKKIQNESILDKTLKILSV